MQLQRWALEALGALLFSSFLLNGVLDSVCVHFRPRSSVPEKGWNFPHWTKFGTCYMSAFETLILNNFFYVYIPVFAITFSIVMANGGKISLDGENKPNMQRRFCFFVVSA